MVCHSFVHGKDNIDYEVGVLVDTPHIVNPIPTYFCISVLAWTCLRGHPPLTIMVSEPFSFLEFEYKVFYLLSVTRIYDYPQFLLLKYLAPFTMLRNHRTHRIYKGTTSFLHIIPISSIYSFRIKCQFTKFVKAFHCFISTCSLPCRFKSL